MAKHISHRTVQDKHLRVLMDYLLRIILDYRTVEVRRMDEFFGFVFDNCIKYPTNSGELYPMKQRFTESKRGITEFKRLSFWIFHFK